MRSPSWTRPSPQRLAKTACLRSRPTRSASSWAPSRTPSSSRSSLPSTRNNSADVLAILGRLLDAGNGPQPLARQFVRYLRNCTVAKITNLAPDQPAHGLAADLLQISPEERSRAARSAALFTEEELSRFLSILLRTFDDLGFRQEPRFHLELGVLKLVHLQRLLPVEDLLTQLGATKSPPAPSTTPTNLSSRPEVRSPQRRDLHSAPPKPRVPHSYRRLHRRDESGSTNVSATSASARTNSSSAPQGSTTTPVILSEAAPAAKSKDPEAVRPSTTASIFSTTDGSLALAPEPTPTPEDRPQLVEPTPQTNLDLDTLQSTLVSALAAVKGQQSASDAIHDATLTVSGDTLQIQTTLSKAMLPIALNPEANRILTTTLRQHNPTLKFTLLPGTPAAAAPKKKRAAAAGSAPGPRRKPPTRSGGQAPLLRRDLLRHRSPRQRLAQPQSR